MRLEELNRSVTLNPVTASEVEHGILSHQISRFLQATRQLLALGAWRIWVPMQRELLAPSSAMQRDAKQWPPSM